LENQDARSILFAFTALFAFAFSHSQALAQARGPSTAFEQNTYVYEPWIKGKFSEVVTVKNPGKWIFLAGIGPESEGDGKILFPGDFYRQCKYAYYRIKKLLAMHGATLKNVVFVTTYMMDIRHIGASGKCPHRGIRGGWRRTAARRVGRRECVRLARHAPGNRRHGSRREMNVAAEWPTQQ
jgi:enamine deaminase RidA (YjgF/YER057c/UK114 family)